jgi:hypothetical protein
MNLRLIKFNLIFISPIMSNIRKVCICLVYIKMIIFLKKFQKMKNIFFDKRYFLIAKFIKRYF